VARVGILWAISARDPDRLRLSGLAGGLSKLALEHLGGNRRGRDRPRRRGSPETVPFSPEKPADLATDVLAKSPTQRPNVPTEFQRSNVASLALDDPEQWIRKEVAPECFFSRSKRMAKALSDARRAFRGDWIRLDCLPKIVGEPASNADRRVRAAAGSMRIKPGLRLLRLGTGNEQDVGIRGERLFRVK
jgi:hypothetical protein